MKTTIDVQEPGVGGVHVTERPCAHRHVDVGSSGTCRIGARTTHADDGRTENLPIDSLRRLVEHAGPVENRLPVRLPKPRALRLERRCHVVGCAAARRRVGAGRAWEPGLWSGRGGPVGSAGDVVPTAGPDAT